jgi:excisionase family DNA binding protein
MDNKKEVLNVEEAAELLGVSVWTVREEAHAGHLPARKVGRAWRFSRQALLEHLRGSPDTPRNSERQSKEEK